MLMVPDWITPRRLAPLSPRIRRSASTGVRLETLEEGHCAQTLHLTGKHHEIYFSDFRKTDPSKLRTILRQPVTEAPL
jgi:hypothetical protein